MSKKNKYPEIQKELRERQTESQAIRQKINQSSGRERYDLWDEKRDYGDHTRDVLLAYALLRKVPYLVVEGKCREGNEASAHAIQCAAVRFGHELTKEQIQAWLEAEAPAAVAPEVAA